MAHPMIGIGSSPKNRTFDGRVYRKFARMTRKVDAVREAGKLRAKGRMARVVKEEDGYAVYQR
jgi:hypothetical protein